MTKTLCRVLCLTLCAVLVLSLAACGGSKMTAEKFVQTKEFQEEYAEMKASLEGSGMSMEITGEGDTLIYNFKFEDLGGLSIADIAPQLESGMDAMKSTFIELADALAEAGVEKPVVRVTYLAPDDTEIVSKDYTN